MSEEERKGNGIPGPLGSLVKHIRAILTGAKYLMEPRMTVRYPEYLIVPEEGYRGMIRLDLDKCISCMMCARVCPASAIKMYKKEGKKPHPGMNYMRCIFCGYCVDICPVNALSHEWVHDLSFYRLDDMVLDPDGFSKEISSPATLDGAKRVRVIYDGKRGLRHVPS